MITPRGLVARVESEPAVRSLYLRRDEEALLGGLEWDWVDDSDAAYVFPSFDLAEAAAKEMRDRGEKHVFALVFGSQARSERALRRAPQEGRREEALRRHQEMMERMHLA